MKWQVKSTKYVVKDKWISLRSDECILPNGNIIEPYYVLDYPDWVNVVAITANNEVVMLKQYRHGINDTVIEIPCGSVETTDGSSLNAAKRELLEETGYTSNNFIQLSKLSPNPSNHSNMTYCYLALDATLKQRQQLDDTEQIEVVKIPLSEVKYLLQNNMICQALHVSALFYALNYLESEPGTLNTLRRS